MSGVSADPGGADDALWRRLPPLALAALAFAIYGVAAAPAPYLLDSAELADAAFSLGVAHPPGEPLAALWGKLWTLLPLGGVAMRVGLGQAAAGALATALVYLAALKLVVLADGDGRLPAPARAGVAATSAILYAFAPGSVLSSDRPEVYALATALALAALLAALRARMRGDARPAFLAALLIGLGLGNHPLIAGAAGVGAVVAALALLRPGGVRFLAWSVAALAVGAAVLAYLPARTAAAPGLVWGDAVTSRGFLWLASARAFAGKQEVVHRYADAGDAPFVLMEELGPVAAILALGGAYAVLRHAATRGAGLGVVAAAAGSAVAALVAGIDPQNPDVRGYLGVAVAGLAILAGAAWTPMLAKVALRRQRAASAAALALAAAALVFALPRGVSAGGRRHAVAAADAAAEMLADLPPSALLLTSEFQTAFLAGYLRAVEGARPDVSWLHLGFARSPGYAERLARREPALSPLLASLRSTDAGAGAALLAALSPWSVRSEPDFRLPAVVRARLRPARLLWEIPRVILPSPADVDGAPLGEPAALRAALEVEAARDHEVRGFLAWRLYGDARLACERGLRLTARATLDRLTELVPGDTLAASLARTCVR